MAIFGISQTSIAAIVLPNYNTNPIGERAGLQGGAFLVRVNDVSATWYNPAGLVKAQRNSITGNASAFVSSEAKKDEADEGSTFVPVPSLLGSVGKLYPNLAWGFSVATPNNLKISNEIRSTKDASVIPATDYTYNERNDGLYSLTTPGIAIGTSLSENLRIGFGVRYYMFEVRNSRNILHFNTHTDNNDLGFVIADSFDVQYSANSLRANFGLQYDINENLSIGFMFRSPNIQMGGEGSQYQVLTKQISGGSEITTLQDERELEVDFALPYEIGVGISYTGEKWEFEANFRHYGAVDETDLLDFTLDIKGLNTSGDPYSNLNDSFDVKLSYEFESIINYSFGIGRKIGKSTIIQAGYYTDKSPLVGDTKTVPFSHMDLVGYTFGFTTYTKNSSSSYGVIYISGEQEGVQSENKAQENNGPVFDTITQSVSILGLQISGSYYF
jgi:long-subunit fatty acid transport protein